MVIHSYRLFKSEKLQLIKIKNIYIVLSLYWMLYRTKILSQSRGFIDQLLTAHLLFSSSHHGPSLLFLIFSNILVLQMWFQLVCSRYSKSLGIFFLFPCVYYTFLRSAARIGCSSLHCVANYIILSIISTVILVY